MKSFHLEIIKNTPCYLPRRKLQQWLLFVLRALQKKKIWLKKHPKALRIIFLSESEIKKVNRKYRKKNKPTDVLSFSIFKEEVIGEILLCPQFIRKKALQRKEPFYQVLCYVCLHGVLHLLGLDHERGKNEAKKMYDLQNSLFNQFFDKNFFH